MADDIALQGVAELTKKLQELGGLNDGKALRGCVRAGMYPAFLRAHELIPVGTVAHRTYTGRLVAPGFSKRSLRIVVQTSKDKQAATALLGPSKEGYYATQFTERGFRNKAARPWLRPALFQSQGNCTLAMAEYLKDYVTKVAQKGSA